MRIIYSLFFLLTSVGISAQETKTYHEETGFFEKEATVSAYDFVFQTYEETKQLWKLDVTGVLLSPPVFSSLFSAFRNDLLLEYERKIGKAFSINNSVGAGFSYRPQPESAFLIGHNRLRWNVGLQPRWYFQMKKRIASGASANNLSGNYVGLGWSYAHERGTESYRNDQHTFGLKYGIQRRIFGRGFIDIQIGPQFTFGEFKYKRQNGDIRTEKNDYWLLASQVKLGFVLGQSNLSREAEKRCDVFQCFEERKGMFKLDLLNALNMYFDTDQSVIGTVNLAYEFKVAPAWSINNEFNLTYFFKTNNFPSGDNLFLSLGLTTQARYYYDLKKRIAQGKSSNNLTGNYVALQAKTSDFLDVITGGNDFLIILSPIWGLQRAIFEKGFIDYSLGFNLLSTNADQWDLENRTLIGSEGFNLRLISQLRIGFKF